eukprot:Phypoly_transcript_18007.p1 GENE.Phypoly_transcript_18007~~Phypoly_transcript_18007.p1  ORF type:complete len:195 (+),score=13.10 Phypoly_transcript_18007:124-708(+)
MSRQVLSLLDPPWLLLLFLSLFLSPSYAAYLCKPFNGSSFCGPLAPSNLCVAESSTPIPYMKSETFFNWLNSGNKCPWHPGEVPAQDKSTFCASRGCERDSDCAQYERLQCFISCMYCRRNKPYCTFLSEHELVAPKHTRSPDCFCYGNECDTWDPFKIILVVLVSLFTVTLIVVSIVKFIKHRKTNKFKELHT